VIQNTTQTNTIYLTLDITLQRDNKRKLKITAGKTVKTVKIACPDLRDIAVQCLVAARMPTLFQNV
jgi:hypothetical protein